MTSSCVSPRGSAGTSISCCDAWEVREVRHVHPVEIGDDVERNRSRLQRLAADYLVQVERGALAVADGVDHHQRLSDPS